jgi:hypothetical protein
LRDRQPLADHSRKALAKEHQQFGAVAGIEAELGALPECEKAARQGRLAIDADQGFGADQVARRAEQRMTARNGAHLDAMHAVDRAAKQRRIDDLDPAAIRAEALLTDDQRQRHRVNAQDQRPFLRDDVQQSFNAVGIESRQNCLVDLSDCARMAAGESDQILVRLFSRAKPLPEMRHRAFFEGNDRRHGE